MIQISQTNRREPAMTKKSCVVCGDEFTTRYRSKVCGPECKKVRVRKLSKQRRMYRAATEPGYLEMERKKSRKRYNAVRQFEFNARLHSNLEKMETPETRLKRRRDVRVLQSHGLCKAVLQCNPHPDQDTGHRLPDVAEVLADWAGLRHQLDLRVHRQAGIRHTFGRRTSVC